MHLGRNLTNGALGGLLRGAVIGLVEAIVHLWVSGAPDLWSLPYGVLLYGFMGFFLGIAGGVAATVLERMVLNTKWKVEPFLPYVMGEMAATVPLVGFVLFYLANKVVYLEQGVPLTGLVAIVGVLGFGLLVNLIVGRKALDGFAKPLLTPIGTGLVFVGATLLTLVLALLPLQADPRSNFAANKPVTEALSDKPNILFIMVDTLRGDHLGSGLTPNLDTIGQDGIVFDNAYAQASWTRSSGASLWTSRLPSGHNADTKAARLPEGVVTWAEAMVDQGVTTGALINNINLTSGFGFDQGFDSFVYESPEYRFGATESVFSLTWYKVVHKVAEKVFGGAKNVEHYYQPADVVLSDAQSFIQANRDGRWALFVHLMEPHDPYFEHPALSDPDAPAFNGVGFGRAEVEHPDPEDAEYLRRVYADEVRWLDREVQPFLEWMRAEGLYDDTFIVLTSDHGEEFHEHGGWWHGTTLYDEQLHVPLVIKPAAGGLSGVRVPWQVRNVDVPPTLTAALGLDPDPSWIGSDLIAGVQQWRDEQAATAQAQAHEYSAWMAMLAQRGLVDDSGAPLDKLPEDAQPPAVPVPLTPCDVSPYDRLVVAEQDFEGNVLGAIRTHGMKLMRANEGNPRGLAPQMLFHVAQDPKELVELGSSTASVCGMYPVDWASSLGDELATTVLDARAEGVDGGDVVMTRAECEALLALGYIESCDGL